MLSILIVEDDITFSLMLTTWLGKKGFVVRSSSSVSDAKRRLGEEAFDLVISDLRLPDSDGIDLLKWLKNTHPSLPLIMMTSYAEIQTAVQAMKLGAADYIAKPLNPDELLERSRNLCTWRRRLRRESRFLRPRIFISRGRAKRPASFMSMCVWWLRRICRYW